MQRVKFPRLKACRSRGRSAHSATIRNAFSESGDGCGLGAVLGDEFSCALQSWMYLHKTGRIWKNHNLNPTRMQSLMQSLMHLMVQRQQWLSQPWVKAWGNSASQAHEEPMDRLRDSDPLDATPLEDLAPIARTTCGWRDHATMFVYWVQCQSATEIVAICRHANCRSYPDKQRNRQLQIQCMNCGQFEATNRKCTHNMGPSGSIFLSYRKQEANCLCDWTSCQHLPTKPWWRIFVTEGCFADMVEIWSVATVANMKDPQLQKSQARQSDSPTPMRSLVVTVWVCF